MVTSVTLENFAKVLRECRWETARRFGLALAATPGADLHDVCWGLHDAYVMLGDFRAARELLGKVVPRDENEQIRQKLLLGMDYQRLSAESFYRSSEEARAGLSVDEYAAKYHALADREFAAAKALAETDEQEQMVARTLQEAEGRKGPGRLSMPSPGPAAETAPVGAGGISGKGSVRGEVRLPSGAPVAGAVITLGLGSVGATEPDVLTATTDDAGTFCFAAVPAGQHEFLAVTLDGHETAIHTRFFHYAFEVLADRETVISATAEEWISAPPREIAETLPEVLERDGLSWQRIQREVFANPFDYAFPRQAVRVTLPTGPGKSQDELLLLDENRPDSPLPLQLDDDEMLFFMEVSARSDRCVSIYRRTSGNTGVAVTGADKALRPVPEAGGDTAIIDTGCVQFRIAWGEHPADAAPLLGVKGDDQRWRGQGRLRLPGHVSVQRRTSRVLTTGPLETRVRIDYRFSNGGEYSVELTAHRDERYLLVHEMADARAEGAFQLVFPEFAGGRGYLHWKPEDGSVHWTTLSKENHEIARLQESVAWWIRPQGFAYAMTADGLDNEDYIAVFTRRRGEWVDRLFEKISQGPGDDNRELDWPFPEMVGSTVSMITAHTAADDDPHFHFRFFDGERKWGLLVSNLARNDGPHKELSAVQHKNSSARLQEFKDWHLDEQDKGERPRVMTCRGQLPHLRSKRLQPEFQDIWAKIRAKGSHGSARGMRAAVDGDPVLLWHLKKTLLESAHSRSQLVLLGREYGDLYSPVGGRGITPEAEQYDLIAPFGVFTPSEERFVRAYLMLMGHMYMNEDFMNWRYNSRNANFEADRVDIVGTIGLAFRGNPDADRFIEHAACLMESSLNIYCTPGSGKWYENPACYYLHASSCRLNLAYHLWNHGIFDSTRLPRLRDFLGWGPLLLTPPRPADDEVMLAGTDAASYREVDKVRCIPPIGDHAQLGRPITESFALMAKAYRREDPQFADFLWWAYQACGAYGGQFSKLPLFFAAMEPHEMTRAPMQQLSSRRLEGFGAVFRGNFNREDEFYLLFKQGPGGYRYHRTEGSVILFADGKPLIYDGGEAGETWRHTTLSFHETHMPLAPGHVQNFYTFTGLDFVYGVHPKALAPGDPVFLSDRCDHQLIDEAYRRFAEPDPADVRSVMWVKNEYVILHDDLHLPDGTLTHWNLQAVADQHRGNLEKGYRFTGRFGTDLQVLLPGQQFDAEKIEQVPILEYHRPPAACFSMRHLQLSGSSPSRICAVLRPLPSGADEVVATPIQAGTGEIGLRVQGNSLDDYLFITRHPAEFMEASLRFRGRYGAVLERPESRVLALLAGELLEWQGIRLESDGPAAYLEIRGEAACLTVAGTGQVKITGIADSGQERVVRCDGHRMVRLTVIP